MLTYRRALSAHPVDPAVMARVSDIVRWYEKHWRVDMRYLPIQPDSVETNHALAMAREMLTLYPRMWR